MSPLLRRSVPALAALLLAPFLAPAWAQSPPQLIVTPGQGRPGDWFYLAGGGFPAGKTLRVFMWCPDYYRTLYGHWVYELDPAKKSASIYPSASLKKIGSFAGWRVGVPAPYFTKSTPCVIRAADGGNSVGVAVAFKILPADGPQPSRKIPISVRSVLSSGRTTGTVVLDIRSAPGAHVAARAYLRSGKVARYTSTLPWTGHRVVRWRVGQNGCGRLKLSIKARLGDLLGERTVLVLTRC